LKKSNYLYLHPVLIQYVYQTKLNKVSFETGIFLITRIIQRKITLKLTQLLGLAVAWVRARLCKFATASDEVYQLLAHGRWFSPASSTTKTGRHDIAEILLKIALHTMN
jgi:hypothetical protein